MKLTKRIIPIGKTRVKLTITCLAANFIIAGIGLYLKADLSDLGTGLALLNGPLYAYILGQSIRPSKDEGVEEINNLNINKNEQNKTEETR